MKLTEKINRQYIFASFVIVLLGLLLTFALIQFYISEEIRENLNTTYKQVRSNIVSSENINFNPIANVKEISKNSLQDYKEIKKDTLIYDPTENENESYKQITKAELINGKAYLIKVRTLNLNTWDIFLSIGLPVIILIFLLMFLMTFFINKINKKIWQPFYSNLEILKSYSLKNPEPINLEYNEIEEFSELNNSIKVLTEKVRLDYKKLKEFSENASHELQTPLAIIKAKIESMFQNNSLDKNTNIQLQSMYRTINRISKLNKSLTLLTKLESGSFLEKRKINLGIFIKQMTAEFSEITESGSIKIETDLAEDVNLYINENLLEILISNLFTNALKYNLENGEIKIRLTNKYFEISNSGKKTTKPFDQLFERFEKENQSDESPGLGLTIVKQICDINNIILSYRYENEKHIVKLDFAL